MREPKPHAFKARADRPHLCEECGQLKLHLCHGVSHGSAFGFIVDRAVGQRTSPAPDPDEL